MRLGRKPIIKQAEDLELEYLKKDGRNTANQEDPQAEENGRD